MDGWFQSSSFNRFDTTVSSWKGWNFLALSLFSPKNFTNQIISLDNFIMKAIDLLKNYFVESFYLFVANGYNFTDVKLIDMCDD